MLHIKRDLHVNRKLRKEAGITVLRDKTTKKRKHPFSKHKGKKRMSRTGFCVGEDTDEDDEEMKDDEKGGECGAEGTPMPPATPNTEEEKLSGRHKKRPRLWGAGIVTPWLYYMGMYSTFGMHFEDYAFGSANVILSAPDSQAWVVWYSVPRKALALLHEFLRHRHGSEYRLDCLEQRRLWIDPQELAAWRSATNEQIPVYRHVQKGGEYVITDYGSVHWGVNLGVGWKAAVNFAFPKWYSKAREVDAVYKDLEKKANQTRHYRSVPNFEGPRCCGKKWPGMHTENAQ